MNSEELKFQIREIHEGAALIDWSQPLQVCSSAAGYYIGMMTADGEPMCRLSTEYFRTTKEAQEALQNASFHLKSWL